MAGNFTEVIKVTTVGTLVATGAASSAAVALPVGSTGAVTKYYRFVAGTGAGHVIVGSSAVGAATANDLLITTTPVILDCTGCTHFRHIQETAAVNLQISPVETG